MIIEIENAKINRKVREIIDAVANAIEIKSVDRMSLKTLRSCKVKDNINTNKPLDLLCLCVVVVIVWNDNILLFNFDDSSIQTISSFAIPVENWKEMK